MSKLLDRYLRCSVDFSEFHLLDVIPKRNRETAVLLVPRHPERQYSYYALVLHDYSHWYCSFEALMRACRDLGYVGSIRE